MSELVLFIFYGIKCRNFNFQLTACVGGFQSSGLESELHLGVVTVCVAHNMLLLFLLKIQKGFSLLLRVRKKNNRQNMDKTMEDQPDGDNVSNFKTSMQLIVLVTTRVSSLYTTINGAGVLKIAWVTKIAVGK